uniref:Ribonuclease H n=1 Tax=Parastrongyloides trichosuri TaxID=131310 RepID=A0A0N4Z866_PARTI
MSTCEKIIAFANRKKPTNDSFETFINDMRHSLKDIVPDTAIDWICLFKVLPLAGDKILEELLCVKSLTLEKFMTGASNFENHQRLTKLLRLNGNQKQKVVSFDDQQVSNVPVMKNSVKDIICVICKVAGHYSNKCPEKRHNKSVNDNERRIDNRVVNLDVNNLTVEGHELFSLEWLTSPLVYVPIEYGPLLMNRVLLDSGSNGNLCPLDKLKDFMDVGFTFIETTNASVRGFNGVKKIEGYINVELCSMATRKRTGTRIYFAPDVPLAIDQKTALEMDLSVEKYSKEVLQERALMIQSLDRIYTDHADLVGSFLEHKETFDDSVVMPQLVVNLQLHSAIPNKIFKPYGTSKIQKSVLCEHLAKELSSLRIKRISNPRVALPVTVEPVRQRVVTDSRWLNKYVMEEPLVLPDRSYISTLVGGSEAFTVFDFKSAFKLCLVPDDVAYVNTVVTEYGYFESNRLQFGTKSASGLFHAKIQSILCGLPKCLNYVDDVLFYGSIAEQKNSIQQFLKLCSRYALKFNISKMQLLCKKVKFLGGFMDVENGWLIDPARAAMLQGLARPKTRNEALSFIGRFIYVSKNIKNYCGKVLPIIPRSKEVGYLWDKTREASYLALVDCLQEYQNLAMPVSGEKLNLYFFPNAQYLHMELRGENEQLIDILSRVFSPAEKNYSENERELLGVAEVLQKSRAFFLSHNVTWVTKSKIIAKLMEMPLESAIDSSARVQRFLAPIVMWGVKCVFSNDFKKVVGQRQSLVIECNSMKICVSDVGDTKYLRNKDIFDEQSSSELCGKMLDYMNAGKRREEIALELPSWIRDNLDMVSIENGLLSIDGKVVLSKKLMKLVVQEVHSLYHGGKQCILNEVSKYYTGIGWSSVIAEVLDACTVCLMTKSSTHKKPAKWEVAVRPRQRGHYDLAYVMDETGKKQTVICFVDAFSSYLMGKRLVSKHFEELKNFFVPILDQCGFEVVICDNEPSLVTPSITELFASYSTYHATSVPYAPASNGIVERYIGLLKKAWQRSILDVPNLAFDVRLERIIRNMNNLANSKSTITPAQLFFTGCEMVKGYAPPVKVELPKQRIFFKPRGKLSELFEEGWLVGRIGNRINLIEKDDFIYHVSPDFCHQGYLPNKFTKCTNDSVMDDAMNLVNENNPSLVRDMVDSSSGGMLCFTPKMDKPRGRSRKTLDFSVPHSTLVSERVDIKDNAAALDSATVRAEAIEDSFVSSFDKSLIDQGEMEDNIKLSSACREDYEEISNLFENSNMSICDESPMRVMNNEGMVPCGTPEDGIENQKEWLEFMTRSGRGHSYVFVDGSEYKGKGCAMFLRFGESKVMIGGAGLHGNTTNNGAELLALIFALDSIGSDAKYPVLFFSDSSFVVNTLKQGWFNKEVTSEGEPRSHLEKFKQIVKRWRPNYQLHKVRAHGDILGNLIADKLARLYAQKIKKDGFEMIEATSDEEVLELVITWEKGCR